MNIFEELLRQAPDSLIRDLVLQLFPTDGGSGFSGLMLVLNTLIASGAIALFLFQLFVHLIGHGIAKAESGEKSDDVSLINQNTVMGYLRSVFAIAMIVPLPGTGLNMFNYLVITLMLAGSNAAQMGYDQAFESMYAEPIDGQVSAIAEPRNIGMLLFEANVCYFYLQLEKGGDINRAPQMSDNVLEFSGRSGLFGDTTDCGRFTLPDMSDAVPMLTFDTGSSFGLPDFTPVNLENLPYQSTVTEFATEAQNIFNTLQRTVAPVARRFALASYPDTADDHAAPGRITLDRGIKLYERMLNVSHGRLKRSVYDVVNSNRHRSESAKWYNAGGYMRRLSEANFKTNKLRAMAIPEGEPTQWTRVWSDPPGHVKILTNRVRDFLNADQPAFVQYVQNEAWGDDAQADSKQLMSLLFSFLNDSIVQFDIDHTQDEHPLSVLVSDGNFFQVVGASIAAAQTILSGIPIIGNLQDGAEEWLTPIMWLFLIAGFILATILPLLPWLFSVIALFSWVVVCITVFIAGSLWVATHVRIRSGQVVFGSGWVGLLEVFLRPLLILLALWVSYELFIVASQFLAATFSNALNNMQFSSIEVIFNYAFYAIMYSILQLVAAVASFWIIVALPGEFSQRIPHEGDLLGGTK